MERSTDAVGGADRSNMTYSVIVLSTNPRPSGQFLDQQRVRAFGPSSEGSGVVSVQFADPLTRLSQERGGPPFHIGHPGGVDKRVRIAFLSRNLNGWPDAQVK